MQWTKYVKPSAPVSRSRELTLPPGISVVRLVRRVFVERYGVLLGWITALIPCVES